MESSLWHLLAGSTVAGKYRLLKLLGTGGHGGVFSAEPIGGESSFPHVAIKLMQPPAGREELLLQEVGSLAGLSHPSLLRSFTPGICTLNDVRLVYLPCELADSNLAMGIEIQPFSVDEVRDAGVAAASALVYLAEQQRPLVHRDVKPANLMRVGARWKLGDFSLIRGVASAAGEHTRNLAGTAEYAPPESYDGVVSPAWDVWSLAVTLHEAATGNRPFEADTPQQLMHAVCSAEPAVAATLPESLAVLIRACLVKDPASRLTAQQFLAELEAMDSGAEGVTPSYTRDIRRRKTETTPQAAPAEAYTGPLSESVVVDASGGGDCRTLQEGLQRAAPNATVTVMPGVYSGPVAISQPITLAADEAEPGAILESVGHEALIITAEDVHVSGLTVRVRGDDRQSKHHALRIDAGSVDVSGCDISSSSHACVAIGPDLTGIVLKSCVIHEGKTAGILCEEGCEVTVESCTIRANFGPGISAKPGGSHNVLNSDLYGGRESGVLLDKGSAAALVSCSIYENEGAGLLIQDSASANLKGCAVYANKHAGISARAHSTLTLAECDVTGNMLSGIALSGAQAQLAQCNIHGGKSSGITVSDGGRCVLESCEIVDNGFAGIKLSHAGVLEATQCRLLSGKRNAALVQDESFASFASCELAENGQVAVLVEAGGRADFVDCVMHDCPEGGVTLHGEVTLERCEMNRCGKPAVEASHGGNAAIRNCAISSGEMPGILVHGKSEAVVERCQIVQNKMPGIAVGETSKALISECTVSGGAQVGLVFWDAARGFVDRCSIRDNVLDGVRIMQGSEPAISGCEVVNNGQYALHITGRSGGEVNGCNLAGNGAGAFYFEEGCTTTSSDNTE